MHPKALRSHTSNYRGWRLPTLASGGPRLVRNAWLLALALLSGSPFAASAQIAVPEDNLAYPVLVTIGQSTGSGFYLNKGDIVYLVTARHVLQDPTSNNLRGDAADLLSYSRVPAEEQTNELILNLADAKADGSLKVDLKSDVAVVKIGHLERSDQSTTLKLLPNTHAVHWAPSGIVGADVGIARKFEEVRTSSDIYIFGYPASIGLAEIPQVDNRRPLIRKGIVSGRNPGRKTIIIDAQAFPGNSGGLVIEVDDFGLQKSVAVIGLVTEYVPFDNNRFNLPLRNPTILNSGYAVVVPMDFVLSLLD
jgi:Trypsin-like peptidase domain